MSRLATTTLAAALTLLVAALPAPAQEIGGFGQDDPVRIEVAASPAEARPGETVTVRVTVTIEPEYHIYGLPPVPELVYPTKLTITPPPGFRSAGRPRGPEPDVHVDETLGGIEVPWFRGTVVFEQDLVVAEGAAPGRVQVGVALDYMACTDEYCLDPSQAEGSVSLTVKEKSFLGFLIVAFLGGLGSILLPCIYPLIPLTLAFFSKHEGSRASAVGRAILFCVGILITFTGLGVAIGPFLQQLAASLALNTFLFLLMLALAASLLGMFDFRLPASWTEKMQTMGSGASVVAPVFMGLAFSLASFTCTVGVIGPLLAATEEWSVSAAGMFSYALGFSLPFFVLALFPVLVSSMPRSGGWMNSLKVLLGLFEICFAGYYLWRMDIYLGWGIGTYPIVLSLWTVTTFIAGLYMLGKVRLPHDEPVESVSVPRVGLAIVYFAFAIFLFAGLMNQVTMPAWIQGLLPPQEAVVARATGAGGSSPAVVQAGPKPEFADETFHPGFGGVWWTTDYERGLSVARRSGRRVFLNFTGIYCTNCRTMETGFFELPAVRQEFEKMVLVELWTDIPNDEAGERHGTHTTEEMSRRYQELRREEYRTTANPHYVILSPEGKRLAEMGYTGDLNEFLTCLGTGSP
jgi:thiol:disulfide interchange protein DsbD